MRAKNTDQIFGEIVLLPEPERRKLYTRMQKEFYPNSDTNIVAHTAAGTPLTKEQYIERVNAGIAQCERGESTSLEELSRSLGYEYADL